MIGGAPERSGAAARVVSATPHAPFGWMRGGLCPIVILNRPIAPFIEHYLDRRANECTTIPPLMGTENPRRPSMQQHAANTREAILHGAAAVFIARGFSGPSRSEVMAAANVTKGSLYFHFKSKEELALAVIEAQHDASTAAGADLFDPSVPGLRAFITLTARYAIQMLSEPLVRAGIRLTMEAAPYTEPIVDPYLDRIQAGGLLLSRAQAAGEIGADVDVTKVARFIVPVFTGIQLLSDDLASHQDLYQRVREMWELVIPALVRPDEIAPWRENVSVTMNDLIAERGV